jgi:hypothetical protein
MVLALTEKHTLPDGIHDASLEEIKQLFGSFQRTSKRCSLFKKLAEFIDEVRNAGVASAVIIDGSFIMGCIDEPSDIDIILVLPAGWDMTQDLRPYQYNLVSKKDVKRKYMFDCLTVRAGSEEEQYWISYFSQVNVKWYEPYEFAVGATKGLVRITI